MPSSPPPPTASQQRTASPSRQKDTTFPPPRPAPAPVPRPQALLRRRGRFAASRIAAAFDSSGQLTGDPRPSSSGVRRSVCPRLAAAPASPYRRRGRFAASRIAVAADSSRQPTGDSRLPSSGVRRSVCPRPRKSPGRGRSPFLVSAFGGKNKIIFPGDMCGGKNSSHEAKCRGPGSAGARHPSGVPSPSPQQGWGGAVSGKRRSRFPETSHRATCEKAPVLLGPEPFRAKAQCEAPPAMPEGPRAIVPLCGTGLSSPQCSSVHWGEMR